MRGPMATPSISHRHIAREDYMDVILYLLAQRGGSADSRTVLDGVAQVMAPYLTDYDREPVRSTGEARWRNHARWGRNALVERGLLLPSLESGRSVWTLSHAGLSAAPAQRGLPGDGRGRIGPMIRHRTTRRSEAGPVPSAAADRLALLAATFAEAERAPPGPEANPAMGGVIATLERVLDRLERAEPSSRPPRTPAQVRAAPGAAARRPSSAATPLSSTGRANLLDLARLEAFVEGRWKEALEAVARDLDPSSPATVRVVDEVGCLPLLASLLGLRRGWVEAQPAARLCVRVTGRIFSGPGRLEHVLGAISSGRFSDDVAEVLSAGLVHRALTALVQVLDAAPQEATVLPIAVLRARVGSLRDVTGEVEEWPDLPGAAAWRAILSDDPTLPAPGELESAATALACWLGEQPVGDGLRACPPPGALLWHPQMGWASVCPGPLARYADRIQVSAVGRGEELSLKRGMARGWLEVSALVSAGVVPRELVPVATRVQELAQAAGRGSAPP